MSNELEQRFQQTIAAYQQQEQLVSRYWEELHTHYAHPARHYHNISHLEALFSHLDQHQHLLADPELVAWTIWYHDIIYHASRSDNEEQSAILAATRLTAIGMDAARVATVVDYIRATAQHLAATTALDSDLAYFLDFDLAILGATRSQYVAYAHAVRQEYRHVPAFLYKRGREKVLRYFLAAPLLYRTPIFQQAREAAARENLEWELLVGL